MLDNISGEVVEALNESVITTPLTNSIREVNWPAGLPIHTMQQDSIQITREDIEKSLMTQKLSDESEKASCCTRFITNVKVYCSTRTN